MIWNAQLTATVIGSIVLPVAGWAYGAYRAGKKQISEREAEIVRLRDERAKTQNREVDDRYRGLKDTIEQLSATIMLLGKDMHMIEIKIAQQYVTTEALRLVEQRWSDGVQRLEDKLDRLLGGER